MNIPLSYAYKLEGQDIDDGMENYEAEEKTLADEALAQLEEGIEESDFASSFKVSGTKKPSGVPAEKLSITDGQDVVGNNQNELSAALLKIIEENFNCVKNSKSKADTRLKTERLKLCMYSLFLLGFKGEGCEYEENQLLHLVNTALEEINATLTQKSAKRSRISKNKNVEPKTVSSEVQVIDNRRLATTEIVSNKGLTRLRPKDRKNPRLNQRRRYKRGLKKVRSSQKSYKPEDKSGFSGVKVIRPHIIRSQGLK
ncbi:hypothetical protein XU18_1129 [Perkinsela sp. CCAP 1560/4]|nr:hypothetical protein XU18_1129 [Perkinsela sp. CCAP 1560/4]|eukprot:KNH08320.1 hypothetical protein XU18_1129 [Perkinsela sp. CCAP 1560/4]